MKNKETLKSSEKYFSTIKKETIRGNTKKMEKTDQRSNENR
jgi:hypothetical protein